MRQAFVLVFALTATSALAEGKAAPGTYKDWNDIDSVEILQAFRFADFGKLVVTPLDKTAVPLPPASENTYAPTKQILEGSDGFFLEGVKQGINNIRKGFPVEAQAEPAAGTSEGPKALVMRAKLLELDPGSQAARYFGGFGAGAGRAKIALEIVDSATGTVLARFTHEKRSGTGMMGGSYEKVMSKSIREVGKDFAKGLKAF